MSRKSRQAAFEYVRTFVRKKRTPEIEKLCPNCGQYKRRFSKRTGWCMKCTAGGG